MNSSRDAISSDIARSLSALEIDRTRVVHLAQQVLSAANGALFGVDLLAIRAVKRFLSCTDAFKDLVASRNSFAAKTILRTHIDTAMRFSAAWLVSAPEEFSTQVFQGARIDKLLDRNGKHLRDAYIIEKRSDDFPWLKRVYESLSGYVHFSHSHISGAFTSLDDEARSSEISISSDDQHLPDSSWIEIIECFQATSGIIELYLTGWLETKNKGFRDKNFAGKT